MRYQETNPDIREDGSTLQNIGWPFIEQLQHFIKYDRQIREFGVYWTPLLLNTWDRTVLAAACRIRQMEGTRLAPMSTPVDTMNSPPASPCSTIPAFRWHNLQGWGCSLKLRTAHSRWKDTRTPSQDSPVV